MTVDREAMVSRLWEALNNRDGAAAAPLLHPDVEWANIIEGDRCLGREAVVDYWRRTSGQFVIESTPLTFETRPDGRLAVRLQHTVRRPDGRLWTDGIVTRVFSFKDGLISRADAE